VIISEGTKLDIIASQTIIIARESAEASSSNDGIATTYKGIR